MTVSGYLMFDSVHATLVSFAAVIRVVTQRSSPLTVGERRYVTTLITAAEETKATPEEFKNGDFTLNASNVFLPHYTRDI